jgi:bromodomain-containing factor 1
MTSPPTASQHNAPPDIQMSSPRIETPKNAPDDDAPPQDNLAVDDTLIHPPNTSQDIRMTSPPTDVQQDAPLESAIQMTSPPTEAHPDAPLDNATEMTSPLNGTQPNAPADNAIQTNSPPTEMQENTPPDSAAPLNTVDDAPIESDDIEKVTLPSEQPETPNEHERKNGDDISQEQVKDEEDTQLSVKPAMTDEAGDIQMTSPPMETQQTAPSVSATTQDTADDTPMESNHNDDVALQSVDKLAIQSHQPKVAREREEDDEDSQPSAKRTKTEEADDSGRGVSMSVPYQNGDGASTSDVLTDHQMKLMQKAIQNSAKSQTGKQFRRAVIELWPHLKPQYEALISNPVDLGLIENRLKEKHYTTMPEFRADLHLLVENCCTFNGAEHDVSRAARSLRDSIFDKVRDLPRAPVHAPKKEKAKAPKRPTPKPDTVQRANTIRKQSKGFGQSPAQPAAPPATTFALNPNTQSPVIRRDSTKGDRPKRDIHPPKTKDLPYSAAKPRNKKVATELKFCEHVLTELKKPKYHASNMAFMEPVDPVALNIPNYFTIIKSPMDLSTVTRNLRDGTYTNSKDFEKDVRLIFSNCFKFNPPENSVHAMGKDLLGIFDREWAKKQSWVAEHSPAAASPSPQPDSDEEESEEEDEQDESAPAGLQSAAASRLIEEQAKLILIMQQGKKGKESEVQLQHAVVNMLQQTVLKENEAVKKSKKTKTSKPKKASIVKKEKAAPKSKKPKKSKYMGTVEKEVISNGLSSLPDDIANTVLEMIKKDQNGVDVSVVPFYSSLEPLLMFPGR